MAGLIEGMLVFIKQMKTLRMAIAVWASLFPFPQIFIGGYLTVTRGLWTPGGWLFTTRILSFLIAGQVAVRKPYSKLIGPIMHIPFFVVVPMCLQWLQSDAAGLDPNMAWFTAYSSAVTAFSLVLDGRAGIKALLGGDLGLYVKGDGTDHSYILPIPSILIATYFALG